MLKVLIPTDFSPNAEYAIDFILQHVRNVDLQLFLVHVIKAPNSATGVLIRIDDLMRQDAEQEMKQVQSHISETYGLDTESQIKVGSLNEWVNKVASHYQVDMLAMGTKGESNIESKIFGSVTESIIRTTTLPVLAVPACSIGKIEHIAIATTEEHLHKEQFLALFINSLIKKNIRINAIKVLKDPNEKSAKRISLGGQQINVETINNFSVVDGLNYYIDTVATDILIIFHERNSKLDYFFNRSITKNICATTNVPLLVIHNN